tara:strand:+ start:10239 stop:10793 length:555 start_codon:yes stop_codon:yes gene_type:complete
MKKVVFLGSDGSGKSSLINYVKEQLEKEGNKVDVVFMGWKDFYNPLLRLVSKIYLRRKKKSNEKKLRRFRVRSWGFYFIYYSELWIRYLKVLLSRADYVLIDRYFYDELSFSGRKLRFLSRLTPSPDKCFVLRAGNNILKERGVDVSKEELDRFYLAFEKLDADWIDSSGRIEDTFELIKEDFR